MEKVANTHSGIILGTLNWLFLDSLGYQLEYFMWGGGGGGALGIGLVTKTEINSISNHLNRL